MNREITEAEVLDIEASNILLELPTGYGKSKIAIDYLKKHGKKSDLILIVVPRLVLIQNWKDEIKKWGFETDIEPCFVTYVSFPKMIGETSWHWIIFDECHHLSDKCMDELITNKLSYDKTLLLSATVNRDKKKDFKFLFPELKTFKITARQAIESQVLPDPKIYLFQLIMDNSEYNRSFKKGNGRNHITCKYPERWKYIKDKKNTVTVQCTQRQYYLEMSEMIEWYKRASFSKPVMKNFWLQKSGQRLKWLSEEKLAKVIEITNYLKKHDKRFLVFCNNIEQTNIYGNPINCKESSDNLVKFNNHEINNISACNMLDEGVNLTDCQIGVYANLNSSERMITQKLGRILRHEKPIIIIPYFQYSRDEEIVKKMMEDYNPDKIKIINNLNDLIL